MSFGEELNDIFWVLEEAHILNKQFLLLMGKKLRTKLIKRIFYLHEWFLAFFGGMDASHHQAVKQGHNMGILVIPNPFQVVPFVPENVFNGVMEMPIPISIHSSLKSTSPNLIVRPVLNRFELIINDLL